MKRAYTVKELRSHITSQNLSPVGFVPTMGALHNGHLSLVRSAITDCPKVVVSIFVNPSQFNDKADFKNYPRTPVEDIRMLGKVLRDQDIVFVPEAEEIYPKKDERIFDFGNLDKVMEGLQRPGHFNGVAQVVTRLFDIVKPDNAYFGRKDIQQLTIIKELVRQTSGRVQIIGCPIVRESDGLAMSSRNRLLDKVIREKAGIIFRAISTAAEMAKDSEIIDIIEFVKVTISRIDGFSIEYFEIVDEAELVSVFTRNDIKKGMKYFGCIAVRAGKIRLIDNIEIPLL